MSSAVPGIDNDISCSSLRQRNLSPCSTTASEESCDDLTEFSEFSEQESYEHGDQHNPCVVVIAGLAMLAVASGCACQAPFEILNSSDKGCAHLLSLGEHVFGVFASWNGLRRPRVLPLRIHIALAACGIGYTQFTNMALSTTLPMTVLVTMKNGNLVANMLLGTCLLRRRYCYGQYVAVLCVSMGLVITLLSGTVSRSSIQAHSVVDAHWGGNILGIVALCGALLSRAASGVMQELWCRSYLPPVEELLAYRSLLGLPIVLMNWTSIVHHASRWNSFDSVGSLPPCWMMWMLLIANMTFDHVTRMCITHLIDKTSSLTANLVLTVQRFCSFVISMVLLRNESHMGTTIWFGALLVLFGAFIYAFATLKYTPFSGT